MFQIRNISGIQQNYSPGAIRRIRAAQSINPTSAVTPISTHPENSTFRVAESRYRQASPRERKKALCAKDIMRSPVLSVSPSTTMAVVNGFMTTQRYRHIPVVDNEKRPVGIISDRDVLRFNVNTLNNSLISETIPVSELMTKSVLTALPEAEIHEVVRVMFNEQIGAMPIVLSSGELIGIITRSDILRALLDQGPIELWV